jgi:hypothetical protein
MAADQSDICPQKAVQKDRDGLDYWSYFLEFS